MYKLNSTVARKLIAGITLVTALFFIYMLGVWLELLWYSAQDSSARFWSFSPARICFALSGVAILMSIALMYNATQTQPIDGMAKVGLLVLAALTGGIWALGLWEFLAMQMLSSELRQASQSLYTLLTW